MGVFVGEEVLRNVGCWEIEDWGLGKMWICCVFSEIDVSESYTVYTRTHSSHPLIPICVVARIESSSSAVGMLYPRRSMEVGAHLGIHTPRPLHF